ncbi:unnamed protein product [Cylicocyclus nassatus]|uniref:Major facilitator superfamily (MFS) profile domain-containing protein n=1 Tax=Cylicocyclus nassatus TaxID=53992 RepID=A0AA36HAK1_CYLNA|nr:unnamed protein product [Cylicocyclus nassatus]
MDTNDFVLRRIKPQARPATVLLGGLFSMLSYGVVYTFGNLLPYLASYLRWKVDPTMRFGRLMWLQTLMSSIPFAMLMGGVLERKIGGRKTAIIGSIIYTSSIGLTYFSIQHSFVALLLSMGIFASAGQSIAYNAILTTAQRWFPDEVGLAGGMIVAGYGSGAFVLAPLQTAFINPLDYRANKDGFFTQVDLLERVPQVFIVMAVVFALLQIVGLPLIGQPIEELDVETEPLVMENRGRSVATHLKSPTFIMLFVSLTFNALWVQLVSGLYKAYGQQFINSDAFLSLVGSLAAISNALSRVIWGVVADRTSFQLTMSIVCTLGAMLVWLLPAVQLLGNDLVFLAVICGAFTCIGGTYSLFPYITHKCFGSSNFGVLYGCLQCALTVAGVASALLSQFVLPMIGFNRFFLIMGGFMAFSLLLTTLVHCTVPEELRVRPSYEPVDEE